jgi:uncharacterized protein (TIGR02646 family)
MIPNNRKTEFPKPQSLVDNEEEWHRLAREADKDAIDDKIYRGQYMDTDRNIRYQVRELLRDIYHKKCAYCETIEHLPDVEHYRPKKGVTGVSGHPGYYWLCYEWSNLLPACTFCNSRSGKWNKFPLLDEANRIDTPVFLSDGTTLDKEKCHAGSPTLMAERPMLFHPELEDPSPLFKFSVNGSVEGVDSQGRGNESIRICDLDRENLRYRRQSLLDDVVNRLKDVLFSFLEGNRTEAVLKDDFKMIFKRLESKTLPQAEFSLMATYIFNHFEEMVVSLMDTDNQKQALRNGFQEYQAGNL